MIVGRIRAAAAGPRGRWSAASVLVVGAVALALTVYLVREDEAGLMIVPHTPEQAVALSSAPLDDLLGGRAGAIVVSYDTAEATGFQIVLDRPMAIDATLPMSDRGRSSTYHLSATGLSTLNVTVMKRPARLVGVAPEWLAGFHVIEAHWIGPDLGFSPAGGQ
jgi:hypothetical protein